jgi:hypothetical protein
MRRIAVLSLGALVLAACSGGGGGHAIGSRDLPKLLLQREDVSSIFKRLEAGPETIADLGGNEANGTRFGREGGWKARYRRVRDVSAPGAYILDSRAEVFKGSDGASKSFDSVRSAIEKSPLLVPRHVEIFTPNVGAEAFGATVVQRPGRRAVRLVTIIWRNGNVKASLSANGFADQLSVDDVVALARAQDRHIRDAG